MVTTIQISEELQNALSKKKIVSKETYEEVIWNLVEDSTELNIVTKKAMEESRAEIASGKFYTHEEVKKRLGL